MLMAAMTTTFLAAGRLTTTWDGTIVPATGGAGEDDLDGRALSALGPLRLGRVNLPEQGGERICGA